MTEIERRVAAVEATIARFQGRPFAWGKVDCAKMLAWHLRKMGHRQNMGWHRAGGYSTALGAKRALRHAGFVDLPEALDQLGFTRIAPAALLAGDVVQLPGEGGLASMAIVVGNGRIFGFHQAVAGAEVLQPAETPRAAWRI